MMWCRLWYTHVFVCRCTHPAVQYSQGRTSDIQLYHSSPFSFETGSLIEPRASLSAGSHLFLDSHIPSTGAAGKRSHGFFFHGFLGPL